MAGVPGKGGKKGRSGRKGEVVSDEAFAELRKGLDIMSSLADRSEYLSRISKMNLTGKLASSRVREETKLVALIHSMNESVNAENRANKALEAAKEIKKARGFESASLSKDPPPDGMDDMPPPSEEQH